MALRTFGARQVEAGLLPEDTSPSFLTKAEQYRYLDDPAGWFETVTARKAHYDQVAELQEPFLFVGDPGEFSSYPRRDAVKVEALAGGDTLQGVPGCPGTAVGIARVVTDSHNPTALQPGDILVAGASQDQNLRESSSARHMT